MAEKEDKKTKGEYLVEYIKSIKEIDDCVVVYREQKKELKKDFLEKKWLSKDDIKYAMKAYALLRAKTDMFELDKAYNEIQETVEEDEKD